MCEDNMKTQVTFRHMKSRQDLQDAAIESAEKFDKFLDGITHTGVEFIADSLNTVEFTVHAQGSVLKVTGDSDDFHKSLHEASDKMIRQLRKKKTKQEKPKSSNVFMVF